MNCGKCGRAIAVGEKVAPSLVHYPAFCSACGMVAEDEFEDAYYLAVLREDGKLYWLEGVNATPGVDCKENGEVLYPA